MGNLNPDVKKKKKKKKNKENDEVVEKVVTETTDDEPKKKKKKKNKEKPAEDTVEKESEDSGSEESGPFKKQFYSMTAKTEAMSKADTKEYQSKHNITMFGKGRKKFKPLQTFAELGFPEAQGGDGEQVQARVPQDADRVPHKRVGHAKSRGPRGCRKKLWCEKCVCLWRGS